MNLEMLNDRPPDDLASALAEFESRFTYPLGPDRSFRISHGEDYPRFFRSMGAAACIVALQSGAVRGALSLAIRTVIAPGGGRVQAAYIGDLRVDPSARGSLAFIRLARDADRWARPQVTAAFGVVMDGTRAAPSGYTGRAGIPGFFEIGKIDVIRLPADIDRTERFPIVAFDRGEKCYFSLSCGRYFAVGGNPAGRSEISPFWLVHHDGLACGRLEDTRRAKRLIDNDGFETKSAHLACFASRTPGAGSELIHAARHHAARLGFPSLFVSVPHCDVEAIESALGKTDRLIAPATVYGAGLPASVNWNINSSEI